MQAQAQQPTSPSWWRRIPPTVQWTSVGFLGTFVGVFLFLLWWRPSWVRSANQSRVLARVKGPLDEKMMDRWRETVTRLAEQGEMYGDELEDGDVMDLMVLQGSLDMGKLFKWTTVLTLLLVGGAWAGKLLWGKVRGKEQ